MSAPHGPDATDGFSLTDAELIAARDWLNETYWSACPLVIDPTSPTLYPEHRAELRRDIEGAIDRHYEGGLAGFVTFFIG